MFWISSKVVNNDSCWDKKSDNDFFGAKNKIFIFNPGAKNSNDNNWDNVTWLD